MHKIENRYWKKVHNASVGEGEWRGGIREGKDYFWQDEGIGKDLVLLILTSL